MTETTKATTPGLLLPCPMCGNQEAVIHLNLADADGCKCQECDEEFTIDDVRGLIEKWTKVIKWVEMMPQS
jgi:hypothetical protein